jgi:trigger factor
VKVTTETLPERQVLLQIEVDDDQHAEAMESAYKKLAPRVQIPGFRPGKAPRPLIEKQLGRHRLLDEAMDILLPKVYREALDDQELDPVAQPSVELVSHEPLVFKATVPLQPLVDLEDYKSLRVPRETVEVKEERIEEAIDELRRRYGTIEPVERSAQKGDIIRGDLRAESDGNVLYDQDEIEYRLTDESLVSLPGLADAVVGLKKGDEVEKSVEAPEDFADTRLAGKTVNYKLKVHDVKEEKSANLDDAFAKEVGEGFDTVKALRERVHEDMEKAETEAELRRYETAVVDALADRAKLEYPAVMLEHEIDHMLEDQANLDPRDPRAQEMYLQRLGKSEEEVRNLVREDALQRLRRSLVLSEFAKAENITVEDSDVDAELQEMAGTAGEQSEAILRLFDNENGRDTLRRSLLTRKTLARLVEIAGADGAAEPKTKAQDRRPKSRRSSPRTAQTEEEAPEGTEAPVSQEKE